MATRADRTLSEVAKFLSEHPYFRALGADDLDLIERLVSVRSVDRGEIVALEGEPCERVYFVMRGSINALKMSALGREQVVNTLWPGQEFYLAPALDGSPLPVTTQALEASQLLAFRRQDLLNLMAHHSSVAMQMLKSFAHRLRRMSSLVEDLALKSVPERLARLLLDSIHLGTGRMTQKEMAARVGTVREVVARTLSTFEHEGWIAMHRGRIEILDEQALADLANM